MKCPDMNSKTYPKCIAGTIIPHFVLLPALKKLQNDLEHDTVKASG